MNERRNDTYPREIPSRVKDLVDIILLIEENRLPGKEELRKALKATFDQRNTHAVPASMHMPPPAWKETYAALALECGVTAKTIETAHAALTVFWEELFKQ